MAQAAIKTQLQADLVLVKANQQTYALVEAGFRTAVNSALDLSTAQLNLDTARLALIQSQYSRLFNLINLYQALGGGWEEFTSRSRPTGQ